MTSPNRAKHAVPAEQLRRVCPPVEAGTAVPESVIGQGQALASVDLGLRLAEGDYALSHYNICVVGSPNTGRTAKTLEYIRAHAAGIDRAPPDAICLHDFAEPRRPAIIYVANGKGREIKKRLASFGKYASQIIPQKVADLRSARTDLLQATVDRLWMTASEKTAAFFFLIVLDDNGHRLAPMSMKKANEPMSQEEYDALPDDIRDKLDNDYFEQAHAVFKDTVKRANLVIAASVAEGGQTERQLVKEFVDKQMTSLRKAVGPSEVFERYLTELEKLAIKVCLKRKEEEPSGPMLILGGRSGDKDEGAMLSTCTQVSLLVDNQGVKHPPVVHVTIPQYSELFGRISAQMTGPDTVRVDHTMVEGGALLQANGGYLVFDMGDLLRWGGGLSFYKLLKVIRTRILAIEGKSKFVDAETMVDFRAQDVPVNVRVVVICDRYIERMLRVNETEFDNLFRVIAEFDDEMSVSAAPAAYAAFVELCRGKEKLPEFTPEAVAKLVEYGCRRAGGQKKASAEFGIIKDVITEAAHWSKRVQAEKVGPEHVNKAIEERFNRQALIIRRYQENFMDSGKLLIECDGAKVGSINGLAVLGISEEISFGTPTRITARAYAGPDKVVLVQREAKTSGPSANTATAVIRGYLSGQYGRKKPPSIAVQLCFEQCYGGIDGDSATLAEVIALISAITELPIDQRLAITGSMNQWGEAQPIGGVNEKIEGHFGILKRRGLLQAGHGVVMPTRNLDDLMLKEEVVEGQRQGLYQVYAVDNIDQALEIFLGRPAQEIHELVEKRLAEIVPETPKSETPSVH